MARPGRPARAASGGLVRIAGTGGALGGMRALADAYMRHHPGIQVQVLPSLGTTGGIAAVLEGAVDVAVAARNLNERERLAGARGHHYARTPVAFATHLANAVRAVTLEEVTRIYTGTLTTWPDGTPIRVVRRPHYDSDPLMLGELSPAMARAMEAVQRRPGLQTAGTDQDNAEALEAVHGSFGTITLAQSLSERRRLTLLRLDGVEPSLEALAAGRYPLAKSFCIITRAAPGPAAAAFIGFVTGSEGTSVLAAFGHEPILAGQPTA